jgi:hypothetical protein
MRTEPVAAGVMQPASPSIPMKKVPLWGLYACVRHRWVCSPWSKMGDFPLLATRDGFP